MRWRKDREFSMKFFFLIVFLVCCSQSAWAEKFYCPSGEELSKVVSAVGDMDAKYIWVNSTGVYVDSWDWATVHMKNKIVLGKISAIYQQCYLLKKSEWSPAVEFFDNHSGKKIGEITSEGRYREK